ncbi:MAG TPA: nucleotidyltransferase domain-containing protein [Methanothrix sp.]|nr:nucleotidyltransferase domain-containing protein [Methanothrix sp.]HPT19317.1 nucleotidyltransferase domain-containing protein [Methanothrix sp.]
MPGQNPSDQQKAEAFLKEFADEISRAYGDEIDFILLFGSAARGEFVLGKSDVDLVIQVKSQHSLADVERFASQLFWRMDEKHGTQFKRVVSTGFCSGFLEGFLKRLEKQARLYKPFEVFGPGDIIWQEGKIRRPDLLPGAALVASQLALFYKMKHEGKILLGRDIRPEIQPCFSRWESLKAIWVPQSIAAASIILAPLHPQKAAAYAVKALFYEVESVNLFLTGSIPQGQEKLDDFASATVFSGRVLDSVRFFLERKLGLLGGEKMQFIRQAAAVKRQGFRGDRREALQFCRRAFRIIWSTNAAVIVKWAGNL